MLIPQHTTSTTPSAKPSFCDASTEAVFQFKPLSVKEVKGALNVTRITGVVSSNDISSRMLKNSCKEISSVITNIYNKYFACGLFPTAWKKVIITPTYKKGCKYDMTNYRPIAILPILSRIFERLFYLFNCAIIWKITSFYPATSMVFVQLAHVRRS